MSQVAHEFRFVENWFAEDAQVKFERYLTEHAEHVDSYLEIGVCEGGSMLWVLENLKPSKAVGVDWWRDSRSKTRHPTRRQLVFDEYRKNAYHNLAPWLESGQVRLVQNSSKSYMGTSSEKFDLIYVDGDHSGNGAMRDFLLAYELLTPKSHSRRSMVLDSRSRRVGGIMVIDDLQRLENRGKLEVKPAWDLFLTLMHGRVRLLWEDGRQAACIRID